MPSRVRTLVLSLIICVAVTGVLSSSTARAGSNSTWTTWSGGSGNHTWGGGSGSHTWGAWTGSQTWSGWSGTHTWGGWSGGHTGSYWNGGNNGGGYYGGYYGGYPYYSYYYPYYYSSSYCSSNSNYYGYPYYYSSYSCNPSSYALTVSTDPSTLGTVTGGGSYTSGSSASFSVTQSTVQVSSNTRYVFDHWSGDYSGTGTTGTVTVNNAMTITAEYQLQYYLTVNAQPQNAPAAQGAGWYNAGNTVTVQNGGQTIGDSASRLVFQGWSVDAQAPQSGSTLSVEMNAPHNVTAVYGQQYYLNVQTDEGIASGSGWYDAGSTAQISVTTPVSTQYGVSIVFNGWQGDVQSSSQSTTVLMDGPKAVVATWGTDSSVLYETVIGVIIAIVLVAGIGLYSLIQRRGGTTMAESCSRCGRPFRPADSYCSSCGAARGPNRSANMETTCSPPNLT